MSQLSIMSCSMIASTLIEPGNWAQCGWEQCWAWINEQAEAVSAPLSVRFEAAKSLWSWPDKAFKGYGQASMRWRAGEKSGKGLG